MKKFLMLPASAKSVFGLTKTSFLILFLTQLSFAQIVIEERIEVNPNLQVPASPSSNIEHIFTYTLSWTPDQYRRGNIQIVDCNNDTVNSGWSTSGITTISFVGNGRHHYLFQEQRWFYHNFLGWGWWNATLPGRLLQVFIDGVDLNHPQNILGSYYGVPNDFNLTLSGSICPNNFAELSIDNINWNYCNIPSFYYGDPLELNIIDGSEFAEFYDINTNSNLGSTVQLNEYEGIQNIKLIRKESAPLVQDIQIVKVRADINGVVDTSVIWYYPVFFTAETEVYPDSITTGEEAYIDIDFFSYCVSLPPETKINIEIVKGQQYGNLIDPYTGERVQTITNLDHWFGYVWVEYTADSISTEITDSVIFKITTTDAEIDSSNVILYIKSPPIYVYTEPEVLGAEDTADVFIKHRLADGTLEDFPPEQTFELGVLDGCVNGNFMVGDSINVYFADALQPIKFVTADELDPEFDKVLIRVGTDLGGGGAGRPVKVGNEEKEKIVIEGISRVDTLRAGFEKMMTKKKAEVETKNEKDGTPPIEAPIVYACIQEDDMILPIHWEGFTLTQDECDEEIVVCNNPQLQNFDDQGVGVIEKLVFNSPWSWTDPNSGTAKNTDAGEGCDEGNPNYDVGLTYVMSEIGPYSQNTPNVVYKLAEDIIVETCLDKSDPNNSRWRFQVQNVRVPIFNDVCTTFISNRNLTDLGDGTDISLLSAGIKNCLDLKRALSDIDWQIRGSYSHPCEFHPTRFIFNEGIRIHEEKHYNDIIDEVKEELRDFAFPELLNTFLYENAYPCPEDALTTSDITGLSKSQQIREYIFASFIRSGANIKVQKGTTTVICTLTIPPLMSQYLSEINADTYAKQTYIDIRQRILNWGKLQSWYKPIQNLDCLGIN